MNFMECCGGHLMSPTSIVEQPTPWCVHLIWAIAIIIVVAIIANAVVKILENMSAVRKAEADAAREFESKMKEKSFKHEAWWHFQNDLKTDFEAALDKRTEELTKRIKQLEEELKQEKASREDKLEREKLQFEHDYYKKLLDDFYGKREENK